MTSTQTSTPNGPADTLRDGSIKATVWRNFGDNGTFYSVEISRTYTDEAGNYHDSHRYSGSELLRASHLARRAYDRVAELQAADRQSAPTTDPGASQ